MFLVSEIKHILIMQSSPTGHGLMWLPGVCGWIMWFQYSKRYGPGWILPNNRLMGMCRWMGSHFHDWIDYNGVAFSIGDNRVTRMGSHICGISGVSKFRQVGSWGIFAQK